MILKLYVSSIILPFVGAIVVFLTKNKKVTKILTMLFTLSTSTILITLLIIGGPIELTVARFTDKLVFLLKPDLLGRFFAGIIASLWPLTTLYAFEYLEDDEHLSSFFCFFLVAYGVTVGITAAGNFFTLYAFYEMLTLSTLPLVMHTRTKEAIRASRVYLSLSIGGAALAFVSMMYATMNGPVLERNTLTQLFYLCGFLGFGVKAAVFPLHYWLPRASAAPMPVTALLHAVAVVKSGVFAIIRLTYSVYGISVINDSFAQYIPQILVIFTIFYGSTLALKETHLKRRLAYSTVANLSYILYGVLLLSIEGLSAALMHMAFHAQIKILVFFAVGAVMHHTHKEYLYEIDNLGYRMPITFITYTLGALALTGIPPFTGFVSKFALLSAGAKDGSFLAIVGGMVLLLSALLTAMYTLSITVRAFFSAKEKKKSYEYNEVGLLMLIPLVILAVSTLVLGLNAGIVQSATNEIAASISRWLLI